MIRKLMWAFVVGTLAVVALVASQIRPDLPLDQLKAEYTNKASRFIELDGMEVHYRDEGTGSVLVLVHGTSSSLHTWDGWQRHLADHFRIIRMDLPGFGLTGPNAGGDYTIQAYVRFLKAFLDRIGIRQCSMAGNSLGGFITWRFALAYPEMVKKMILIDAAGYPHHRDDPLVIRAGKLPVVNKLFTLVTPRYFVTKSLRDVYFDEQKVTDGLVDRYYDLACRPGNRLAFIQRVSSKEASKAEQISSIQTPTLLQWGRHDTWISLEKGERFEHDLPNARLIVYENAGHVPMEEVPGPTAADARQFLLERNN